jgi:ribosome biogenesis SPOUT family RNA methylase Rps3
MVTLLGSDNDRVPIVGVGSGISGASVGSMEIAVVDPKGMTKLVPSSMEVNDENIIGVEIGDLIEKDRKELELQW